MDDLVKMMEETGLPVVVADDPLSCVVRGCGIALEGIGKIEDSIFCFGISHCFFTVHRYIYSPNKAYSK